MTYKYDPPEDAEESRCLGVKDALGSHALEGLYPSEAEKALLQKYINGEITLEELKSEAGIK